jgi:hypothetical protein
MLGLRVNLLHMNNFYTLNIMVLRLIYYIWIILVLSKQCTWTNVVATSPKLLAILTNQIIGNLNQVFLIS